MKQLFTLSLMMLLMASVGYAQSIPVTFDNDVTVGGNWKADSGLSSVSVIGDPTSSEHGQVGVITSSASGLAWQNAQLLLNTNYIDLTTTKSITFDIYTTVAQDFLFKLEQSLNGGPNLEVPFSTAGTGWEQVSVDFGAVGANDQYKLLVWFPCYSTGFANAPFDRVVYIDNVSGVVGEVAVPPSVITLPIDFEIVPLTSDFNNFDGGVTTIISNPQGTGKVAQMVRNGGAAWAGSWIGLNANLDFSTEPIVSMKVYTEAPVGTTIALKVEGGAIKEIPAVTTKTGEWETMSWDFTGTSNDNFKLVFLFDLGKVGDGTATSTFLFDDIVQSASVPTAVSDLKVNTLKFYPNPVFDVLRFQNVEEGSVFEIYGATGRLAKSGLVRGGSVSVADLNQGVYFVKVNGVTAKVIKK